MKFRKRTSLRDPLSRKEREPAVARVTLFVKFDNEQDWQLSKGELKGVHLPVNDRNLEGSIETIEALEARLPIHP
jgi:hypothetical protein